MAVFGFLFNQCRDIFLIMEGNSSRVLMMAVAPYPGSTGSSAQQMFLSHTALHPIDSEG